MTALVVSLLLASAALGADPEEACVLGRVKARSRYESCVQSATYKYAVVAGAGAYERFLRCNFKYASAWTKLQNLTGTRCDSPRWVDNGDATATDNLTGLVWQKTDENGGLTDKDSVYTWTAADGDDTDEDGTVFTTLLANLNAGAGFAGANGWRLPSLTEILTILVPQKSYPCAFQPCIDEAIFGPVGGLYNWAATTATFPSGTPARTIAWVTRLGNGETTISGKLGIYHARAVRGGF